jgi:hypothetical protein
MLRDKACEWQSETSQGERDTDSPTFPFQKRDDLLRIILRAQTDRCTLGLLDLQEKGHGNVANMHYPNAAQAAGSHCQVSAKLVSPKVSALELLSFRMRLYAKQYFVFVFVLRSYPETELFGCMFRQLTFPKVMSW